VPQTDGKQSLRGLKSDPFTVRPRTEKRFDYNCAALKVSSMNLGYAHLQARMIARVAAQMAQTSGPVSDETKNNLMKIGHWASHHAPYPAMMDRAVPELRGKRTWQQVRQTAVAIVDSITGLPGTVESEESEIRTYILCSPDESWRQPAAEEVFIKFGEEGYISLTRFEIRFSRDGYGLDSCTHTQETKGRYETLQRCRP
jgi:hypothetical protein